MIKGLSDAKTGKNWIGWIGKGIVTMDRSLTDIHQQAEVGRQQSDDEWRAAHPARLRPRALDGGARPEDIPDGRKIKFLL